MAPVREYFSSMRLGEKKIATIQHREGWGETVDTVSWKGDGATSCRVHGATALQGFTSPTFNPAIPRLGK